jgi:hypothetical protein
MLPGQYPNPRSPTILYNEKGHAAGTARGRQSGLKSRATKLLAIRFGWVVLVIWFEVGGLSRIAHWLPFKAQLKSSR